jgi:NOL1/NOP2/sun family putative RNA methylase
MTYMQNPNLPEKLWERWQRLFSEKNLENIVKALQAKPQPAFRTNTLLTTTEELKQTLEQEGFVLQTVPWYQDAFILENKSVRELTETQSYKQGHIYIQNLSSMLPALILDPQKNETILDLTAAPGSKTTQIAALMDNSGKIVANDLSRPRLYKLQANLKMYGVTNTMVANVPGQSLWKQYPQHFDRALVDVPCSMEGRINLSDPATHSDWKLGKIKDLQIKQQHLLRSAISATKVGGTIVYSTCTMSPEENEGVLDWILRKTDGILIEKIVIKNLPLQSGLSSWNKEFDVQTTHAARIFPTDTMEGFFVAKILKTKSTITPEIYDQ